MKIKEFAFKNICSYGNKVQTFKFSEDPNLILVQGTNGSGKSSISDALTVSIYGKSGIRKIKEIPNRINKNAYTSVKFVANNGDEVEIERGIEPNFSKILINGNDYNLPDKRRVDEFIEEELVKIPFNVFSNTISLSVNDFKSFVKLSPADKRKIIDKIFGLDLVNDMNQLVKEDAKTVKGKQSSSQTALLKNQHLLEQSVQQLSNLQEDLSQEKEQRIVQLNDILTRASAYQDEVKSSYAEIKTKLDSAKNDLKAARESKSSCTFNIAEIDKKLSIYAKNKCPHCLSDLTDTVHIGIKQQLEDNKNRFLEDLSPIATKISEIETSSRELESSQEKFRNDHAKLASAIDSAKRELDSLTQSQDSEKQTQYLQKIIDQLNEDIESTKLEIGELEKELSVNQELEVILSDNGMKRILMNQIIPLLNKNILRTSKLLEFKFAFEFDLEFNPIITHLGMQISPESLSAGEQKKMNLIVLLCILELIKMKNNKINLLFLDEIFSSLDSVSIYKVVDLLKTFAKKHNMTVFVISHDPLPEEFFDIKLFVENKDHFSDIRVN